MYILSSKGRRGSKPYRGSEIKCCFNTSQTENEFIGNGIIIFKYSEQRNQIVLIVRVGYFTKERVRLE